MDTGGIDTSGTPAPPPAPEDVLSPDGKVMLYGYNDPASPLAPPKVVDLEPMVMTLAPKRYSWCSCGYSKKQPFCDSSHREEENATNRKSFKFEVLEETTLRICMCRLTSHPPYCDETCQAVKRAGTVPGFVPPSPLYDPTVPVPPVPEPDTTVPPMFLDTSHDARGRDAENSELSGSFWLLAGRILLSVIFIVQGVFLVNDGGARSAYASSFLSGLPEGIQGNVALGIGVLSLAGAAMLILGLLTRLAAVMLFLALLPALILTVPALKSFGSLGNASVNLAMLGALIYVLVQGPGVLSIDALRRRSA
jgi:uncharacterized membrane protein YphA (DoxX/SURF4 family)/CDGSH-type Zn-finger protein